MLIRRFVFETRVGDMLCAWLERRLGIGLVHVPSVRVEGSRVPAFRLGRAER